MGFPPWGPRNLGWNDRWHNRADSNSSIYRYA
ncbi:hypothetical protein PVAP13_2NG364703 [Panicum virgatum]|uniref:Uncharacterized protein n=1 Tax=Panicum virgatum TaxID=38727 RepID=A0A8T0VMB5_PANVG|nr:hypothetical protein PVAP13_2NG364703 [Panicum virgatum]